MFKNNIKIFAGNAHRDLAQNIASRLGASLEKCKVDHFLNNETMCVWAHGMQHGGVHMRGVMQSNGSVR